MDKIDLSGYHVLIASPIMDGKVDIVFSDSLIGTKQLLESLGAKVQTIVSKYCADVCLARSQLFGTFLRHEEATHMLSIDSDMGWSPYDVVKMLLLKKDFLAAAGPKKEYPIKFAYNLSDDDFNPIPMVHEIETNVAEVSEVGGAFVLMSRECCQKLADAYPELQYHWDNNIISYDIYAPLIIQGTSIRRRLSEDYAICYRWRQIGGKIEVLLDVTLHHIGSHKFTGSLLEHCLMQDPKFNEVGNGEEKEENSPR